jgi:CheY-like chemotaxis protein
VFYFTIPVCSEPDTISNEVSKPDESGKDGQMKKLKILIAEDDPHAVILLSAILEGIADEILHVETGVEAIKSCAENPGIDLVLMDIRMPEVDGYDAVRQIRKANKDVVIIAQTAYALAGEKERIMNSGFDDYIAKPIQSSELVETIQRHFELNG